MGSRSLGLPGPALFLLLVLPPPLLRARSFLHTIKATRDMNDPGQSRKSEHHPLRHHGKVHQSKSGMHHYSPETRIDESQNCESELDIYFILDMSGSVDNNWMDIYNMVEDLVNKFDNPKVRMSFILYSTDSETLMRITSDRNEIQDGLAKLQNIVPNGYTHMQEGFKKANEQIEQENSKGNKAPTVILALTDGTLLPFPFEETVYEAQESRRLGATVYCIGVKDYRKDQLLEIADSPDHVFGVDNGFRELRNIVGKLAAKSCINVNKLEPTTLCAGVVALLRKLPQCDSHWEAKLKAGTCTPNEIKENYELMVTGSGFNNAKTKDDVICRFIFDKNKFFDKKATSVEDNTVMCPGVTIDNPDQVVFVEVSLNNGLSFISNGANITSKNCMTTTVPTETVPPPLPVPPPGIPPSSGARVPIGALPAAPPPTTPAAPDVPPARVEPTSASEGRSYLPDINPIFLALIILALILIPLLIWCIWRFCFKREVSSQEETQPVSQGPTASRVSLEVA